MKIFAITVPNREALLNKILGILQEGPKSVEELEGEIPEVATWRPAGQVRLSLENLLAAGYIYAVPGGYFSPTMYGKEKAGSLTIEDLTVGNPEVGVSATDTYKGHTEESFGEFKASFKTYWEYFKSNHPEYIKAYEWFETKSKKMGGLIGDVFEILQHRLGTGDDVTPFDNELPKNNGTPYKVPKNLVSVEHAIWEEMQRVFNHDKEFAGVNIIAPEDYVTTTRYLKTFFVKNGAGLVQNVLVASEKRKPGTVLSQEDVNKIIGDVDGRGIDKDALKTSIYGWLVNQTNEGEYGVFLTGTNESSMIRGLRDLINEHPEKGSVIFKNFKNSGPENILNKALSGDEAKFSGVKFDKGDFSNLTISGGHFIGCSFKGSETDFSNATIIGCNFTGASFVQASMKVGEFTRNNIEGADFNGVTGLGDEGVTFKDNIGRPINLILIRQVVDADTYKKVSKDVNRSYHLTMPVSENEREIAQELLKGLHKIITKGDFEKKVSSLRFAADDSEVDLEQLKQQLTEVLDSKGATRSADWMQDSAAARQKLIEYNRKGILKQIGMDSMMGKLIGYLTPKQQKEPDFRDKINEFVNQNIEKTMHSKTELLNAVPQTATSIRSVIENVSRRDTLTQKDLTSIYTALMQTMYSEDSPLLDKIESGIKTFPHAIRLSDMSRDRSSGDYSDRYPNTFGVTIEPYTQGLPENLKRAMDLFLMGGGHPKDSNEEIPSGWQQHWVRAISSARVRPVKFQNYGMAGGESTSAWLIMEVQSDPVQNAEVGYNLFKPKDTSTGDLEVNMSDPKEVNLLSIMYPLGLNGEKVPLTTVAEEFLKRSPALVISDRYAQSPHDEQVKAAIISIKSFANPLPLYSVDNTSIKIKKLNEAYAAKGLIDFRSYYNTWPEVTMLATIRKALEHGGVDEVWIPTAENMLTEAGGTKSTDRTIQYDIPAQRLGGVRFKPPVTVTPDGGSQMWSTQNANNHPQTFYKIDLTPFKMDATIGDTVPSKADPKIVATIQKMDKFSKLEKMIDNAKVGQATYIFVTPRENIISKYESPLTRTEEVSKAQIVIIYSLSTHKGNELFVSTPKDFADQFMVEKRFSNLSLRFTSMDTNLLSFDSAPLGDNKIQKTAASPEATSVLKFVKGVVGANPFLEQFSQPLLLSSGIAKRAADEHWSDGVVNGVVDELQQLGHVVYRPIRRYVAAITHVIKKKLMGGDLQRLVQNMGEPVERLGKEMIISYFQMKHPNWGEEETQYVVSEINRVAAEIVYPQITPRDPFAPDVPRREPRGGTRDPITGEPLQNTPGETPAAPQKEPEGPIPGLTFVKPTGEELEGYNKEYETRLYDRLKKALDDGDFEKVQRLHKMLTVLVSGETSKKREDYTNKLLDYLNEANAANNDEKAVLIKEMLSSLHLTSSLKFSE